MSCEMEGTCDKGMSCSGSGYQELFSLVPLSKPEGA